MDDYTRMIDTSNHRSVCTEYTVGQKKVPLISEVETHARVVLGVGKGVDSTNILW